MSEPPPSDPPEPPWLGALVTQSSEALVAFDESGSVVYANAAAADLMRMPLAQLVGTSVFDFVHEDDLSRAGANISAVADGARPRPGLLRVRRGDGTWPALDITPMHADLPPAPAGPGPLTVAILRDNALADAHWHFLTRLSSGEPFHRCVEALATGLSVSVDGPMAVAYDDLDGSRLSAGPLPPDLAGVAAGGRMDETPGTPWHEAVQTLELVWCSSDDLPEALARRAAEIGAGACIAVPVPDPGDRRPAVLVQWPPSVAMAGVLAEALMRRPRQAVALALDRRDALQRLEHQARHDGLTGLSNRVRFFEELAALDTQGTPYGVCYVDLDGFKPVNDTLGHIAGDEALVVCARRLERVARSGDLVARLGGDEFAVACVGVDGDQLGEIASRLVATLSEPMVVNGTRVEMGASVGCALAGDGAAPDAVLAAADAALYEAKRAGRGGWRLA